MTTFQCQHPSAYQVSSQKFLLKYVNRQINASDHYPCQHFVNITAVLLAGFFKNTGQKTGQEFGKYRTHRDM